MRTITVKGTGSVSIKPDYVVLSMALETRSDNYEKAMREASIKIDELKSVIEGMGFEKDCLKTTDFNVSAEYENKKCDGTYQRIFSGWVVRHHLRLSFDLDTKALSRALVTVAACIADPELSVSFTVKNPADVNEALLKSAAENARKKAEILCKASGVTLGSLISIDYNWSEVNVYSRTHYGAECDTLRACAADSYSVDIEPDDINASDTVCFVWEIL